MTRKRAAQPTSAAERRRQAGTHVSFRAPAISGHTDALPDAFPSSADVRRSLAKSRVRIPLDALRREVLDTAARLAPAVLTELAGIEEFDTPALSVWAQRWGLDTTWVLVVARNTLRLWQAWPAGRGRVWDPNHGDRGHLVPSAGRSPERPPELLVRPEHIGWLVQRRVLRLPFDQITFPPETARKAVRSLALRIGL